MNKSRKLIINGFKEENYQINDETLRDIILEVYNYKCIFTNKTLSKENFHIDHFIPKCKLPQEKHNSLDNYIPVLPSFNTYKNWNFDDLNKEPDILSLWVLKHISMRAKKIRKLYNSKIKTKKVTKKIIDFEKINKYQFEGLNLLIKIIDKSYSIEKISEKNNMFNYELLFKENIINDCDLELFCSNYRFLFEAITRNEWLNFDIIYDYNLDGKRIVIRVYGKEKLFEICKNISLISNLSLFENLYKKLNY